MKTSFTRLLTLTLLAALVPTVALAAKGDRKKKDKNQPTAVDFKTADKDNDGTVTDTEYAAAMKGTLDESSAKLRFGTLDKNADGKLSSAEYAAGNASSGEKKKRKKKDKN